MGSESLTIRLEKVNPRAEDIFKEIIRSINGLEMADSSEHCDLMILEVGRDPEEDFKRISEIKGSRQVDEIFLTALQPDSELLIRAIRTGVKEFFAQPLKKEDVTEALLRFQKEKTEEKEAATAKTEKGKVFTVFGAKGGVGATTLAVNLATGIAQAQAASSVALVDMNLLSGDVPLFLNMKSVFNWVEVARNISRLDATYLMTILQQHTSRVHVLPAPVMTVEDPCGMPESLDRVQRVLELMRTIFDYVIIDGGQLMGQISTYLIGMSDKVLFVTIPSLPGIINVKKLMDALHDLGYPSDNTIVVLNRYNQKAGVSIDEVRRMVKKNVQWSIPNDYQSTMNAINTGVPLTTSALKTEITKKILELAGELSGAKISKDKEKKSFFNRF